MNASTVEILRGAVVSSDGGMGGTTSSAAGGGGSGGSILIEAYDTVSGAGTVRAVGGASRSGSGAGGGGRVAVHAGFVSSELTLKASGGSTSSSSYECAGAAGTLYVLNGTASSLTFDNGGGQKASSTCTPFPADLSGVQLSSLNISGKSCVELKQTSSNNDVRAYDLVLGPNSNITGDSIVIDTSNASVRGRITATSALWLDNNQSGAGVVTAFSGSDMTCSSCPLKMTLAGSDVWMQGAVTAGTAEVKDLQSLSHTGSLRVSGNKLIVEAGTALIRGTVTCTGSACSSFVSVNGTLEVGAGGTVSCTTGKCSLTMRSGGNMTSRGTISCSGNSQCLVDMEIGASASLGGSTRGSDISVMVAEGLEVQGTVSTSQQGYGGDQGVGKGAKTVWCTSAHVPQVISVCQDPAGGMAEMAPIRAIGRAAAEAYPQAARATEVPGFR